MPHRLLATTLATLLLAVFASCGSDDGQRAAKLAEGCLINSDCDSPLVCAFRRCHTECVGSRDCPEGQRCVASDRPFRVCQLEEERKCVTNAECPANMICGLDGECRDPCVTERDCIAGQVCTSGTCADRKELVDGGLPEPVGAGGAWSTNRPCQYSSDCPEPLVCRDGACIIECRQDRDCEYFAACIDGRCRLGGGGGVSGAGGASDGGGTPDASAGGGAGGALGSGGTTGGGGAVGGGGAGGVLGGGGAGGSPVTLFDCGSRGTTGATVAPTNITANETWSGVVHVTQTVSVYAGAVLTIQPGTTIVVDTGRRIEIGWNSGAATILAAGTPSQPISFCGSVEEAGNWAGLVIQQNVTSNSVLENVLIADAGGTNAGLILETDLRISDVQVRNSGADGVWAADFYAGSSGLSVEGATGAAVVLTGQGAVTRFPLGGAFMGNASNVAQVDFAGITADTTFHDIGIPYLQMNNVDVAGAATATFEAGVDYRFAAGTDLEIGWNSGGSTLAVDGTASRPVTFRGEAAEAGNWGGITIDANVTASSHITHARILHGGGGQPALHVGTPITLDNVSFDLNSTGVRITQEGLNAGGTMLSITGTGGVPLTIAAGALTTIPTGGSFTGNATDQVVVQAGDFNRQGVVPDLGIPYFLEGSLRVIGNAVLEIAAGSEFVANANVQIDVGWNSAAATLLARGTAAAPIVFRGLDTANGYWDGIVVRATALSASAIDRVQVRQAGKTGTGGVVLYKEIPVTNTTVTGSAGYGIFYDDVFATNYATTNTLTGNTQGGVGTF